LVGVTLGAVIPFLFSSMAMNAVEKAAQKMIEEEKDVNKQIEYLNTMGILKNNLEKGI